MPIRKGRREYVACEGAHLCDAQGERERRSASSVSAGHPTVCKWGRLYAAGNVPLRSTTREREWHVAIFLLLSDETTPDVGRLHTRDVQ